MRPELAETQEMHGDARPSNASVGSVVLGRNAQPRHLLGISEVDNPLESAPVATTMPSHSSALRTARVLDSLGQSQPRRVDWSPCLPVPPSLEGQA